MSLSDIRKFRRSFIATFGRQPQAILIDPQTLILYKADVSLHGNAVDSILSVMGGSLLLVWEQQSAQRRRELTQKVLDGEVSDPFELTSRTDSSTPSPETD